MDVAAINLKNAKKAALAGDKTVNPSATTGGDSAVSFTDLLNRANFAFDKGSVMMSAGAPFTPKANAADKASDVGRPQAADKPQAPKEKARADKPKETKRADRPEKPENKPEAKEAPKEEAAAKEVDNSSDDHQDNTQEDNVSAKSADGNKKTETKAKKDDDIKIDETAVVAVQVQVVEKVVAQDISINLSLGKNN